MGTHLMKKHDRGWASADVLGGLLVLMVVVTFSAGKYKDYIQDKNWQVEALRTNTYAAATRAYIGRNYATLLNASTTTSPSVITTSMLKNTGFLPVGFTETNSQAQRMQTHVVRNAQNTDLLQAMVISTGGSDFPLKGLIMMSKNIKTGFGGYTHDGQTVTGALRTWSIPLSAYGANTGTGHLAVLLSSDELSAAQDDNDRLYRFQVNGRPDLNRMHTAIDMGENNINNVATVNGQNGNFSGEVRGEYGNFSLNLTAGGQVKGETVQAESDITAGGNMTASGLVTGSAVSADGNLSAGGVLQLDKINISGAACYPNGQVSRDERGGILSCQSGAWATQRNGRDFYTLRVDSSFGNIWNRCANNNSYYCNVLANLENGSTCVMGTRETGRCGCPENKRKKFGMAFAEALFNTSYFNVLMLCD
jgi:hypothetical protein